jgi:hypothetical protein
MNALATRPGSSTPDRWADQDGGQTGERSASIALPTVEGFAVLVFPERCARVAVADEGFEIDKPIRRW